MPGYLPEHITLAPWVMAICRRVDELIRNAAIKERFQRMLREWAAEEWSRVRKYNRRWIRYRVELLPEERRMSLPHKYAALAAIHDGCSDVDLINPWRGSKGNVNRRIPGGLFFAGSIQIDLPNIQDSHRERLEQILDEVERDLRKVGLWEDAERGKKKELERLGICISRPW